MGLGCVMDSGVAPSRSHKAVLVAIRLVLLALIASMALPSWLQGKAPWTLPFILGVYLVTNLTMLWEKREVFSRRRVQALLLLFDISVLVASLVYLKQYRQDLVWMIFLVVLLASAGQRLWISIAGFVAVGALYAWLSWDRSGVEGLRNATFATRLTVLWVVGMYAGYVSETMARERQRRIRAEERLRLEIACIQRTSRLVRGIVLEPRATDLLPKLAETAQSMLEAPMVGIAWRGTEESGFRWEAKGGLPDELVVRWGKDASLLENALRDEKVVRLCLDASDETGIEEVLIAPFTQTVAGFAGCVMVAWPRPHEHLASEIEALQILLHQAAVSYENTVFCMLVAQARDAWQAVFRSVPMPVVILGEDRRILQANGAFARLVESAECDVVGSPLEPILEGASFADGRPAPLASLTESDEIAFDLDIPRLGGAYGVIRGPYIGPQGRPEGQLWLFRSRVA